MRGQKRSAVSLVKRKAFPFNGKRVSLGADMPNGSPWGVAVWLEGKRFFAGTGNVGLKDLLILDRMERTLVPASLIPKGRGSKVKTDSVEMLSRVVILVELHEITRLRTADKLAVYLDLALSQYPNRDWGRRGPALAQAMRG